MNTFHYPDPLRCKKLTELGFPKTEKVMLVDHKFPSPTIVDDTEDTLIGKGFGISGYVCPSVMEMIDMIADLPHDLTDHWALARNLPNSIADLIVWLVEDGHLTFDKR